MSLAQILPPVASSTLMGGAFFCLALLVQGGALWWFQPQKAVGDEAEYLAGPSTGEQARLWLRVPLLFVLAWLAGRLSEHHKMLITRTFVSVLSAATVGLAAGFSQSQAGFAAGLTAGVLMILSVERIMLAIHVWPDALLGFWALLFLCVITGAEGQVDWAILGVIAALGYLTRLDFALLAVVGVVLVVPHAQSPFLAAFLLAGPTLIAASLLALRNGIKHGVWRADTTFSFNLLVSTCAMETPNSATEDLMHQVSKKIASQGKGTAIARGFFAEILQAPWQFLRALLQRVVVLMGRETFVNQKLIEANQASYAPAALSHKGRIFMANLTFGFPTVLAGFLAVSPMVGRGAWGLILGLLVVQATVQTRSRYRMSVFPLLCTSIANSLWQNAPASWPLGAVFLSGMTALFLGGVLMILKPQREL